MNHQMDSILHKLLSQGVAGDVFPGAVAAVSQGRGKDKRKALSVAGIKDRNQPGDLVTADTVFDLASLTKPLSTSLIIYSLIQEGKLQLDDRLDIFFQGTTLIDDIKQITIRQLLSHSSGLPAYKTYFKQYPPEPHTEYKQGLLHSIHTEPLEYDPGSRCLYSDIGFILLGEIIEKVSGRSIAGSFRDYVAQPAGLTEEIFYLPLSKHRIEEDRFASTENCPWRGRVIRAEVHDEHCWLMGGVSGHAGLFGTAGAVLALCGLLLEQWQGKSSSYPWSIVLRQGLEPQYPGQTWGLGFDTPSVEGSSGGGLLSKDSVGHLGYTGTSFWIDPQKELVMVLLTNRVHPSRENKKIREFRPRFHSAIIEGLK